MTPLKWTIVVVGLVLAGVILAANVRWVCRGDMNALHACQFEWKVKVNN